MKRIIFIAILTLLVFAATGQTEKKHFSYAVTLGTGITFGTPSTIPFGLQGISYYPLGKRFSVGAGTGLSVYDKVVLIPLLGDLRFDLTRPRKFTPYVECAAGYAFALSNGANGGFCFNPSVGMKFTLLKKVRMLMAVGYESQSLKRCKDYSDSLFLYEYEEQLNRHSAMVRLGVVF